jgi:prophage regulatory protein
MSVQLKGTGSILRRGQVEREVGLKRSTIYQRMQEGTFPRPIRLGERAVGWRASDIERFLEDPARYRVSPPVDGGRDE